MTMNPETLNFDLAYDEEMEWFEQTIEREPDLRSLTISVSGLTPKESQKANLEAKRIWDWILQNLETIKEYIANSKLLALYNDVWRDEEEEELSAKAFQERLTTITSVGIDFEDGFELDFDDDDLFAGHSIFVSVDESFEIQSANMG
jgi:hypothetical protein